MVNHTPQGPVRGAVNTIQRIGSLLVDIAESRIDLLSVELEQEKNHIINLLLMSGVAIICLLFGVISLLILICWAIDPAYRFIVVAIFTAALLLIALFTAMATIKKVKSWTFLQETRANLKADRALLKRSK